MTYSDIIALIEANRDKIEPRMTELYRSVLESDGRIQYTVYIWEDGELQTLEDVQGGNTWIQPGTGTSLDLINITTIDSPFFDWKDFACDLPDEPEKPMCWDYDDDDDTEYNTDMAAYEAEKAAYDEKLVELRGEVIDYLVEDYNPGEMVDECIREYHEAGRYADDW